MASNNMKEIVEKFLKILNKNNKLKFKMTQKKLSYPLS